MAKDPNSSGDQNSSYLNQDDTEKSLVGKFKSIISNTPLSKWFRRQEDDTKSTIRRRGEEDYEEEVDQLQPPTKRAKFVGNQGNDVSVLPINTSDSIIKDKLINRNYSNFPEPVAGPSGLQSRKLLNSVSNPVNSDINVHLFGSDFLNGHKDSDSEESTSGYSSVPRIGSKEHVCQSEGSSKQPSPLQTNSPNRRSLFETPTPSIANRSLFGERTVSPQLNTSMSSRRPHFNASTFGSPNFIDQTLSTEKVINSPFYNGSTMYGGASAYGNKFGRRTKDLRASLKRSVHIKPIRKNNEGSNLVLGKTARKILETLEQYSSPVNDAKKIPIASKRVRLDASLMGKHVGVNQYLASNRELQVPTVSDLLKMKQKAKLQNSTEAVRLIATSSKSDLNTVHSQQVKNTTAANVPQKIKNSKESAHNDKPQALPSLPVSAIPKFDLVIPPIVKKPPEKLPETPTVTPPAKLPTVLPSAVTGGTKKNTQKEPPLTSLQFKFSDPLIVAENLKSIVAINNFKFSEPLSNMIKTENTISRQFKEKNNGQSIVKNILPNSSLLDKFKPASGTWECSTCLIRNQPEKTKCIACETPKLKPVQTEAKKSSSFGDKFKMQENMWECSVCMIRNSNDSAKCVACETPNTKSSALVSSSSSFQWKFQPPANTWECSTCLIRNKEEADKCAACRTPRVTKKAPTNQLVNSFKMKADEWDCLVCMVRNNEKHAKCQCCEAAKPGGSKLIIQETEKRPVPKFNFGIDKASATQFKFGIQPASTAAPVLQKLPDPVATEAKTTSSATPPTFSFGVVPNVQKKPEISTETVQPVENKVPVSSGDAVITVPEKTETVPVVPKIGQSAAVTTFLSDNKNTSTIKPATVIGAVSAKPAFNSATVVDSLNAKLPFNFTSEKPKDAGQFEYVKPTLAAVAPLTTSTFSFGAAAKPATSTTMPVFGQNKLPSVISGNNGLDTKPSPTFGVINKPPIDVSSTNPAESKLFSFKKPDSNGEPVNKAQMINFGQAASQSANAVTTQSPGFNFAQVAKSPVFNFSAGKTDGGSSGNIFGGAGTGNSKNGPYNFGGPNQNAGVQKTGFNFGAVPTAPASSPFNLGGPPAATQAASAGGFNFTTNVKPSFNFSEGSVTAFSAQQPSGDGGAAAPRKIKRAVRRTQR